MSPDGIYPRPVTLKVTFVAKGPFQELFKLLNFSLGGPEADY